MIERPPTEVHGLPPDPECLHCTLAPLITAQLRRKDTAQVLGELLQSASELIGQSSLDLESDIADAQLLIAQLARQAYAEFRRAWKRPS
jgi:hypothetical protein